MEFRILGSVSVVEAGREVVIPGAKLRALLALLLIRRGETTRADRLADDLWGDAIPAGFQNALQSLVSKLRRALGESGRLLLTDADGYRLDVSPDDLDAHRFEVAARAGKDALAASKPTEAAEILAGALHLWRGPVLQGLADEGVLQRESIRLDELRLAALEDRIDADMRLGRHAELIPELTAITAEHRLRERFHAFLMLALYRCGRQADALRAFQDARRVLGEELGLDPGPELRALEGAILSHDPSLDQPRATAAPAPGPIRRSNLVPGLSSFVGRENDLRVLAELVDHNRLVTIVGPGGAGKTRLSVQMASTRVTADDSWLVELAPLSSPLLVAETIAVAIGAADAMSLNAAAPQTAEERIIDHLSERGGLIVLDNCEHLVAEAARVTEALLVACPLLTILATSREALGVGGEMVWRMPSMTTADSVALFIDRAGAASGFVMTPETEPIVTDLCTRLDGLPLAIELAAGRSRAFPVQQLAARLDDRFRLLTGGARTALPRQQTLRAVVEWSYDLLFEHEQRVFDRLSVFAGGCSLDAAEAVCAGEGVEHDDVADVLGHLVDKSLVIADLSQGDVRFRLLQTLALFGRERLASSPDAHAVRARHAAHFGELCERGHAAFRGHQQEPWLSEVEREVENLYVAMTWTIEQGDALTIHTMLSGLGWSWWFAGRGDDGWRWLTAGLECPGPTTPCARGGAAIWACYVGACAGTGIEAAAAYGWEALELARQHGDTDQLALALSLLADVTATMGEPAASIAMLDEAVALTADRTDDWGRALCINAAGRCAEQRGDLELAERLQRESLAYFERLGVEWALAIVGGNVAIIAERREHIEQAVEVAERARRAAVQLRLGGYEAMLLARISDYTLWLGDAERARSLNDQSIALADEVRYPSAKANALAGRAVALRREGSLADSENTATAALALLRSTGMTSHIPIVLSTLGLLAENRGDITEARRWHLLALDESRVFDDRRGNTLALEGLASAALAVGDATLAAQILGAAHAMHAAEFGALRALASDSARITKQTSVLLGADAFAEAFGRGGSMPADELVAG